MPLETYSGVDPRELLARARTGLGAEAVVLELRRVRGGFELVASDGTAAIAPLRPRTPPPLTPAPAHAALPLASTTRIALVGPTGAGKTTTIAKLLGLSRRTGVRAGVLTLDTFRIGALEQSRALTRSLGARCAVAHEGSDLARALRELRHCSTVFVDTAGRGPGRDLDTRDTWELLRALRPGEVHLTVPAGLSAARARRLLRDYRELGITHLLVTKLDECPEETTWFELAAEARIAMRWVAHGENLERDLGPASDWIVGAPAARAHGGRALSEAS